jgi:hypothetical protein
MHTSTLAIDGNKPGTTFRRKLGTLLDEILFALDLSNRAYYLGVNRF